MDAANTPLNPRRRGLFGAALVAFSAPLARAEAQRVGQQQFQLVASTFDAAAAAPRLDAAKVGAQVYAQLTASAYSMLAAEHARQASAVMYRRINGPPKWRME